MALVCQKQGVNYAVESLSIDKNKYIVAYIIHYVQGDNS
jgi:hypothetical protein